MGNCNNSQSGNAVDAVVPVELEAQPVSDAPIKEALNIATADPAPITVDLHKPEVDVAAPLDDRDIMLVQQTFARVALLGAENVGWVVFMNIFKLAPEAKGLFKFDDHVDVAESSKMKTHAGKVVATVATAVSLLRDLDTLVPVLKELGTRHVGYGVIKAHYDIVGQALIDSLAAALGPKFTPAVCNAYLKVYTIVKTVMIGNHYSEPEVQHPAAEEVAATAEGAATDGAAPAEGAAAPEEVPKEVDEEAKKKEEEEKKKKAAADKKKAEELKKKKLELAKKKKAEEEAKKKKEAAAKKAAEEEARKAEALEKKKERVATFKGLEKPKQQELIDKMIKAAKDGNVGGARAALDECCDPDAEDKDGQTALHYAADKGKSEIVKLMLEYGANKAPKVKLGEWGLCPLHYAARQGHIDIAELVFDAKAMGSDNFLKKTPVEIAQEKGHDDIAALCERLQKAKKK